MRFPHPSITKQFSCHLVQWYSLLYSIPRVILHILWILVGLVTTGVGSLILIVTIHHEQVDTLRGSTKSQALGVLLVSTHRRKRNV